jgi:hypothetical protein
MSWIVRSGETPSSISHRARTEPHRRIMPMTEFDSRDHPVAAGMFRDPSLQGFWHQVGRTVWNWTLVIPPPNRTNPHTIFESFVPTPRPGSVSCLDIGGPGRMHARSRG